MKATAEQEQPRTGLRAWQQGAVFLVACAVIISRRPDAFFHAQFRYEDGAVWFADAYNFGWWQALLRTWQGYYQTLPRLGASLALLVPLSKAPLVLALLAIAVQALPVSLLLCSRSSGWGSLRFRALLAGMFLALPIYGEVGAIMTTALWFLALSAFLLVAAPRPRGLGAQLLDLCILLLSGLTGPFCIVLLPIAAFLAWRRGDGWRWVVTGALAVAALIQVWALLIVDPHGRSHQALGASPLLFVKLLASKVYLGTLLGSNSLAAQSGLWGSIVLVAIAAGGTVVVGFCFLKSPWELRLFILFANMLLVASLISPKVGVRPGLTTWQVLVFLGESRYWFFPMLAFAWSILWCLQSRILVAWIVSIVLLCVMCFGIIREWRQPALRDAHFAEYATEFEAEPAGTAVTIPLSPAGWNMTLVKRLPGR
jgi:hypothetical protein